MRVLPDEKECPVCEEPLGVRKTRSRTIVTLSGKVNVTEVTLHCRDHKDQIFTPKRTLTPPKSRYAYDLIAEAGRLRFLEHKQVSEIQKYLRERRVWVPHRSLYRLCGRFLEYLIAVHLESLPLIARMLEQQGGYVLHVDSTTTKGTPAVLLMKDGWSGVRLLAASIPGETTEAVSLHLESLRQQLGDPPAAIRDMGTGIEAALKQVFPETYILTCHYHFLRNVGERLFNGVYPSFRGRVNNRGVKKRLRALRKRLLSRSRSDEEEQALKWTVYLLDYKKDGNGLAYPFTLPELDFYRRCETLRKPLRQMILSRARKNRSSPALSYLENSLRLLRPPPAVVGRIHAQYLALEERWAWFERIRKALRYRNGPVPLSTERHLSTRELEKGRQKLDELLAKIREFTLQTGGNTHKRSLRKALCGITDLIQERRDELFAPNVVVRVNGKQNERLLPRTNAPVETDFRRLRRHGRRIRGDKDVERMVQRDGVGMALNLNLENKKYVRLVYGHLGAMAQRFTSISPATKEKARALMRGSVSS